MAHILALVVKKYYYWDISGGLYDIPLDNVTIYLFYNIFLVNIKIIV